MSIQGAVARRLIAGLLVGVFVLALGPLPPAAANAAAPAPQEQAGGGCPRPYGIHGGGGSELVAAEVVDSLDPPILFATRAHAGPVLAAEFDASGAHLATIGLESEPGASPQEASVRLWDTSTGRRLASWDADPSSLIAISPDGKQVAILQARDGHQVAVVRSLRAPAGETVLPLEDVFGTRYAMAFDPSGRRLAVAAGTGVDLWNLATRGVVARLQGDATLVDGQVAFGHSSFVLSIAFSADGSQILTTAAGPDDTVRLWDAATGKHLRCFEIGGEAAVLTAARFLEDGSLAAYARFPPTRFRWDGATGELLEQTRLAEWGDNLEHTPRYEYALSPDMQSAVRWKTFPSSQWADLLDLETGRLTATAYFPQPVTSAQISPDGRAVLSLVQTPSDGAAPNLYLWDRTQRRAIELARHAAQLDAAMDALAHADPAAAARSLARARALVAEGLPDLTGLRLRRELAQEGAFAGFRESTEQRLDALERLLEQFAPGFDIGTLWIRVCSDDPRAVRACARAGIDVPVSGWLEQPGLGWVTSDLPLNVRGSPGTSGLRLYQVSPARYVNVLAASAAGDWYYMVGPQGPGWVAAQYLELLEE